MTPPSSAAIEPLKVACASCNLRELCLPVGLNAKELEQLDGLVAKRRAVPRGEHLFRNGERFEALYAVRTGFFKTCVGSEDGRDQVTGFQMAGELLGLDGISSDHHHCDAVALEDSSVCVIPYSQLEGMSRCDGGRTEQLSRFGSTACKSTWRCIECGEPFEYFKPI